MQNEFFFIWEVCPIGLARVSEDGKFIAVNPRMVEITGYSETELLRRRFQDITHPDDLSADVTEADNLATNKELTYYQMVKRYIRKDGHTVWVNIYVYAIRDEAHVFKHFFAFIAELSPIVCSSNTATPRPDPKKSFSTVLDYAKNNPKDACLIIGMIFLLAQGRNIIELLLLFVNK